MQQISDLSVLKCKQFLHIQSILTLHEIFLYKFDQILLYLSSTRTFTKRNPQLIAIKSFLEENSKDLDDALEFGGGVGQIEYCCVELCP